MDWKSKLFQYSLRITGHRWDAEDLAQDAYLKLMSAIRKDPLRPISSAYLYRIALNVWKDTLKKRQSQTEPIHKVEEQLYSDSHMYARELLELLAERLPPRMVVIVLLMDVFDFTAKETAELISSKEATVQVTLGRARTRLRQMAMRFSIEEQPKHKMKRNEEQGWLDFEALVDAFRRRDPQAICQAYFGLIHSGIRLTRLHKEQGRRLLFTFSDPDGNLFTVMS
jgi:RNA polymerase sigma-70 factor (ECF subfamily)